MFMVSFLKNLYKIMIQSHQNVLFWNRYSWTIFFFFHGIFFSSMFGWCKVPEKDTVF